MNSMVQRVTPLTVLADIGPSLSRYRALGFEVEVVDTGDPGCVGLRAGGTYLILATVDHMAGQFRSATVQRLTDQTTPYLYVRSLEEALTRLPATAVVIEKVPTPYGTVEALVEDDGQCMILAEKCAPDA
jgi:hypothetical protein